MTNQEYKDIFTTLYAKQDNKHTHMFSRCVLNTDLKQIAVAKVVVVVARRGCSISKRLVKLTRFKSCPLQLSGHQDIPLYHLCVLRHQL